MSRWWLLVLTACAALSFAQQPPADPDGTEGETSTVTADESVPAGDAAAETETEVAGASTEGDAGEADEEFIPEEEITEDYPVPLPSDI